MRELNDELDDLSKLDELRSQALKLKDEGMRALGEIRNNCRASWNGRDALPHNEEGLATARGNGKDRGGTTAENPSTNVHEEDRDHIEGPHTTPRWQGSGGKIEAAMLVRVQSKPGPAKHVAGAKGGKNGSGTKLMQRLTAISLEADLLQLVPARTNGGPPVREAPAGAPGAPAKEPRSDVDEVPVLLAARAMQALVPSARHTFSRATMLCYYRIIREICVADSPDWNAGGARAGTGGEVTAYVTAECIRAVLMLERSIRATAAFFRETDQFYRYACYLERAHGGVPEKWREIEGERAIMEWYVTMAQQRPYLALDLPLFDPDARDEAAPAPPPSADEANGKKQPDPLKRFTLAALAKYFQVLGEHIHAGLQASVVAFDEAANRIAAARAIEDEQAIQAARSRRATDPAEDPPADQGEHSAGASDRKPRFVRRENRFVRSMSAHEIAAGVIEKALVDARKMVRDCEADGGPLENLRHLAARFEKIALEVRTLLDPAERYIASVMDHELTAASQEKPVWDARELAFAAGAYGALTKWRADERLERAARLLADDISEAGLFRLGKPFHSVPSGLRWQPLHFEVCRSFSELLANVEVPVTPTLITQMLFPFTQMSIELKTEDEKEIYLLLPSRSDRPEKRRGWHMEDPPIPAGPTLWVSGHAVLALDKLVRMLDQKINNIILKYFTSKTPEKIEHKLDHLFYPDYGRELFYASDPHHRALDKNPAESIGITLQRMRAHIVDVQLPGAYEQNVYSAVLHGPPGTGKTTLLEALAKSSDVPLIEMSPSDIAVAGEQAIEARARATFQALSMLTRVVIIFDEFEPVLLKRDTREETPESRSMYTFLTPGMLPKLTRLYHEARHKHTAYALVTNHLQKLDAAAIRPGRFDRHVGIYMPDPVSRAGFFMKNLSKEIERRAWADLAARRAADPENSGLPDRPAFDFLLSPAQQERFEEIIRESGAVPPSRLAPRWLNVLNGRNQAYGGGDYVLDNEEWDSLDPVELPEPQMRHYEQLYLLEEHRLNAWEWAVQDNDNALDELLMKPGPRIDRKHHEFTREARRIQTQRRTQEAGRKNGAHHGNGTR